jgi:hypothetical protein
LAEKGFRQRHEANHGFGKRDELILAFLSLHRMLLRTHTLFHRKVRHDNTLLLFLRAHREFTLLFLLDGISMREG